MMGFWKTTKVWQEKRVRAAIIVFNKVARMASIEKVRFESRLERS